MSSTYLTSHNLNMLVRLLDEVRITGELAENDIIAERLLIHRFEKGTYDEIRLRIVLRRHIFNYPNETKEINAWENEGGAIGSISQHAL